MNGEIRVNYNPCVKYYHLIYILNKICHSRNITLNKKEFDCKEKGFTVRLFDLLLKLPLTIYKYNGLFGVTQKRTQIILVPPFGIAVAVLRTSEAT